jgi:hypothetical protein
VGVLFCPKSLVRSGVAVVFIVAAEIAGLIEEDEAEVIEEPIPDGTTVICTFGVYVA